MIHFFNIENIAFQIWSYPISYVELIATIFGLTSVYFASKANKLTWGTGIVNEVFLFILYYQVQLYPDMFLQIYFLVVTLYGWNRWNKSTRENKISKTRLKPKIILISSIFLGTIVSGYFFENIHLYLSDYFKIQAAYPYADSFVMVSSILATVLLARKKIETWYLWIAIDVVCFILYINKGINFLAIEYLVFIGLALYGLFNWKKQLRNE